MMKNGLFLLMCALFVAACGNKGGNGNGGGTPNGTVATTALNACFNGTAPAGTNCSNINYGNYSQYGFYAYGRNGYGLQTQYWANTGYYNYSRSVYYPQTYGLANYAAFCSCRPGTRPVYLPQGGLGCLSSTYMPQENVLYFGMDATNQFVLTTQFMNFNGYTYGEDQSRRQCYQGVANACHVGTAECGGTASCNPTMAGSPLGICVSTLPPQQQQPPRYGRGHDRGYGGYDDRRNDRGYSDDDGRNGYSSTGSITR